MTRLDSSQNATRFAAWSIGERRYDRVGITARSDRLPRWNFAIDSKILNRVVAGSTDRVGADRVAPVNVVCRVTEHPIVQ